MDNQDKFTAAEIVGRLSYAIKEEGSKDVETAIAEALSQARRGLPSDSLKDEEHLVTIARLRERAAEAHAWEEVTERLNLPHGPALAEAEIVKLRSTISGLCVMTNTLSSWMNLAAHRGIGGHGPSSEDLLKAAEEASKVVREAYALNERPPAVPDPAPSRPKAQKGQIIDEHGNAFTVLFIFQHPDVTHLSIKTQSEPET